MSFPFLQELLETVAVEKGVEKAPGPEHKKVITESKFLEILKERCRNSYMVIRQAPIYVSEKADDDFMIVTPSQHEVKSSFWLDKMIGPMNSWKRFPNRSRYIRGFTSEDRADKLEGDVYVLIPYDMARVGICPKYSFYKSFPLAMKDWDLDRLDNDGLSAWITRIIRAVKVLEPKAKFNEDTTPETYGEFNRLIKEVDAVITKHGKDKLKRKLKENESIKDDERKVLNDLLSRHITSFHNYIEEKLDPENNDFRAVRIESYNHPNEVKEVWVDSPCLVVKLSKYKELYKRGAVK